MNIIKILFFIIWTLWCFVGVFKNFSHYKIYDWVVIIIFVISPYIIAELISKKKEKGKSSNEKIRDVINQEDRTSMQDMIQPINAESPTSYIEAENVIYRTDGKSLSNEEIPNLARIGKEKAIAKWKIPEIERQIKDSYQIMCTTNNPETLCDRYKFIAERINELAYFQQKGLFDKDSFVQYNALITDDNYRNLILACYTKYVNKARSELTTEKGVNNRINKFLKIIRQNVNSEFYNKMFLIKN